MTRNPFKDMFFYKAVTPQGKVMTGLIDAKTVSEAAINLRKHELIPITITEKGSKGLDSLLAFKNRVTEKDIIFFTRQLASMLESSQNFVQKTRCFTCFNK